MTIEDIVDSVVKRHKELREDPVIIVVDNRGISVRDRFLPMRTDLVVDYCQLYSMLREKLGRRVKTYGNWIVVSKRPLEHALKRARGIPHI
ncbi:hypothetical protein ODS41_11600 [Pyrobaculum sp. 3827-6]|uniref:hypothetical protein n=1 Tax=Pyrobaculum sp. 3827-6 TaxID=2983604 RepID=UPI0021DB0673|nr:hypothetical protein [Pyrobaculum sp. 3827-6]MCU7788556.1 hypothetical protein [Pyrobaculum sp. 3827-6]